MGISIPEVMESFSRIFPPTWRQRGSLQRPLPSNRGATTLVQDNALAPPVIALSIPLDRSRVVHYRCRFEGGDHSCVPASGRRVTTSCRPRTSRPGEVQTSSSTWSGTIPKMHGTDRNCHFLPATRPSLSSLQSNAAMPAMAWDDISLLQLFNRIPSPNPDPNLVHGGSLPGCNV